jgi:hypothetical protein
VSDNRDDDNDSFGAFSDPGDRGLINNSWTFANRARTAVTSSIAQLSSGNRLFCRGVWPFAVLVGALTLVDLV